MPGTTVSVPVNIATGSGVRQFALTVAFDPSVVAVQDAQLSADAGVGTLAANSATPGALTLSATLAQSMIGAGALVDVTFTAVGSCPSSTALEITSCVLDGGAIGCQPSDGRITVLCGVGGRIRHWRTAAPVANTVVAMVGARSSVAAPTDTLGQYSFGDMNTGSWELEPRKSGDLRGAVTALDAAMVLQAVAGRRQLNPVQALACDVTGNGQVSALDAARILQLVVGQLARFPVAQTCGSDWAFLPVPATLPNQRVIQPQLSNTTCQPGGIMLDPLLGDAPQQDFTAVLFGDCSGNWNSTQGSALQLTRNVRVRMGVAEPRGGQWAVPIYVAGPSPYQAIDARIAFDATAQPANVRAVGTAHNAMVQYQSDGHGDLTLALASAAPLAADGLPAIVLTFDAPHRRNGASLAHLLYVAVDEVSVATGN